MSLGQEEKNVIREYLLKCLETESIPDVRNKVGDAAAEIARQYVDIGKTRDSKYPKLLDADIDMAGEQWNELLQTLFNLSQMPDSTQRETAFRIFTATPGIIEKQHEENVLAAFIKGFKDDEASVSVHALL